MQIDIVDALFLTVPRDRFRSFFQHAIVVELKPPVITQPFNQRKINRGIPDITPKSNPDDFSFSRQASPNLPAVQIRSENIVCVYKLAYWAKAPDSIELIRLLLNLDDAAIFVKQNISPTMVR